MSLSSLNWADAALLVIVGVSAVFGVLRGLVREALSLTTWLVSIWIALNFSQAAAVYLPEIVEVPSLRIAIAFIILLLAGLLVGSLVAKLMAELVDITGMAPTDRTLGMVFGAVRGVAVVGVLVFLLATTPVAQDPWWKQSLLIGYTEPVAREWMEWLPDEVAEVFVPADNPWPDRLREQIREQAGSAADAHWNAATDAPSPKPEPGLEPKPSDGR